MGGPSQKGMDGCPRNRQVGRGRTAALRLWESKECRTLNATILSVIESRWNTTPFVKARTFLRDC
jgi:hypothetical protein